MLLPMAPGNVYKYFWGRVPTPSQEKPRNRTPKRKKLYPPSPQRKPSTIVDLCFSSNYKHSKFKLPSSCYIIFKDFFIYRQCLLKKIMAKDRYLAILNCYGSLKSLFLCWLYCPFISDSIYKEYLRKSCQYVFISIFNKDQTF